MKQGLLSILVSPVIIFTFLVVITCKGTGREKSFLDEIRLPEGFKISLYSGDVPGARSMTLGKNGTLFVGTRKEGKVYALLDRNGDYRADRVIVIANGLRMPNGVAFKDDNLYVAEISRILRYDSIEKRLSDPPEPVVISERYPADRHHGWKYIAFGPDGMLYVPVGAPCNTCKSRKRIYATITRMNPDGTGFEIYAEGVRNTVGFDWHPDTGILWFTDNGRDWMGNDIPPDELNRAYQKGLHFGYPYCHGTDISDPEYGKDARCSEYVPPAQELGPHVAALGMIFYTGGQFPEKYRGNVFIAEHGSWNRDTPIGYRITTVRVQDGQASGYRVFAEGWLKGGQKRGRPVDVLQLPDGSLLVSDDHAGAIYRIYYSR